MKPSDPAARHGIPPELLRFAVAIDSVHRWPGNPREHDIDKLRDSLRKYGQPKPIVAQESSRNVFAGNGLLEAAEAEGWTHVAVTFRDWPDLTCREFLLDDNKTHDRGHDDFDRLATFLQDLHADGGSTVAFDQRELDKFLASVAAVPGDDDDAPDVGAEPWVKPGELYALGRHRLLCGDATATPDAARLIDGRRIDLVLTDPPYGISLDTDYSAMGADSMMRGTSKRYRPVIGDNAQFDPRPALAIIGDVAEQFWFGGDYYRRLLSADDRDGSWLVWDKRNESSDGGFGSGFELIWSRQRHKRDMLRYYFFGGFGVEARNRVHPTQKPTALLADIMTRWSADDAVVWDGYAGSGSTLIAAERIGRTVLATEIDPRYAQITIERWQAVAGAEAVRL